MEILLGALMLVLVVLGSLAGASLGNGMGAYLTGKRTARDGLSLFQGHDREDDFVRRVFYRWLDFCERKGYEKERRK